MRLSYAISSATIKIISVLPLYCILSLGFKSGHQLTDPVHNMYVCMFGSCLATKVFIGNLQAMGRGWVIIK